MDPPAPPTRPDPLLAPKIQWYRELEPYHWWILLVCTLGWLFDTMDQRIFALARPDAMKAYLDDPLLRDDAGRITTMFFVFGWATGGLVFGILGDRWGRARTMMLTILIYALFTALTGFSQNLWQFHVLRFLTGMGVGGEFSAGVSMLAEVIPERPRPYALGLMQALSAVGNITGALIYKFIVSMGLDWRWAFFAGAIPALLVVAIRFTVKEPESWVQAKKKSELPAGMRLGSYKDLFSHPRWRRNALLGVSIAVVGVVGVWGIGFYTPELVRTVLSNQLSPDDVKKASGNMFMLQDVGAFISMYGFAIVSGRIGRRRTFQLACLVGLISVVVVFGFLSNPSQVLWMGFLLGFGTLSLFGGYAVYFPELFPTRLRSTGVSFCYNVGRYLAGFIQGPFPKYVSKQYIDRGMTQIKAYRATSITFSAIYLVGMVVMMFAPETMGKPLPTDDDPKTS